MHAGFSLRVDDCLYRFDTFEDAVLLDSTLQVTLEKTEYPAFDAVEWTLWLENPGIGNSPVLTEICDCDVCLPLPAASALRPGFMPKDGYPCVTAMQGCVAGSYYQTDDRISATEFSAQDHYLLPGQTVRFANESSRSSDGAAPFFDLHSAGQGAVVAVGWTGAWQACFARTEDGVQIRTGLQNAAFYLEPGEKLRTSSTLIMEYAAGEDAANKFRRLLRSHVSHTACTAADREGLLAFELWGGLPSDEMCRRLDELRVHEIRFDQLWMDAGWYGQCTQCDEPFTGDWGQYTGDWEINRLVHPDGLQQVREHAKAAGMDLMLWFEPERATDKVPIVREHPEWFLQCDGTDNHILYYGCEAALQYVTDLLSSYIDKLQLACLRQDFNTSLTGFFAQNDAPGRRGITEIRHITGMYRLWDTLQERHPGLLIDNCSSGGRRIDIETLRRSIPFFRSDYQCEFNANPDVEQAHNAGLSRLLPYNGCTTKAKADDYAARSSFSSSWGGAFYNAVFQTMDEADFAWAKRICDEYRSIRVYLAKDFYSLGSNTADPTAWAIWQYHDPDTDSGVVLAFRREQSPFDTVEAELRGLEAGGFYRFTDTKDGSLRVWQNRLKIMLDTPYSSVVFRYARA